MIFFLKLTIYAWLSCFTGVFSWPAQAQQLSDRLLLEVNHFAYTQRQLELYILVVDALKNSPDMRYASAGNWVAILDFFKADMVIDQEALRIGSFDPTRKMIEKAFEILNARISKDTALNTRFSQLSADRASLVRVVAQALRVENFRRSKQRQAAIVNQKEDANATNLTGRFTTWQKDLEDRSISRFFKDAQTFVALRTPG